MQRILRAYLTLVYLCPTVTCHSLKWFGSGNDSLCRCEGSTQNCQPSGACLNRRCEKQWFGPLCQYRYALLKFSHRSRSVLSVLLDNDKTTCNDATRQLLVFRARLIERQTVSWIRIQVEEKDYLHRVYVEFREERNSIRSYVCADGSAELDDYTLDILCNIRTPVQFVTVKGMALVSMCSFYVSVGRNMALRGNAKQSTELWPATNAVNSRRHPKVGEEESSICALAKLPKNKGNIIWHLEFSGLVTVNKIVIYSTDEDQTNARGFTLMLAKDKKKLYEHQDKSNIALSNYTVVVNTPSQREILDGVDTVMIVAAKKRGWLQLCEVEVYGERVCRKGRHGLHCEKSCQCGDLNCLSQTGGCLSRCAGRTKCTHETGQTIPLATKCSRFCLGGGSKSCNKTNGFCISGCQIGYLPPRCNSKCPDKFYGRGCTRSCEKRCKNEKCDSRNGLCFSCVDGRLGKWCQDWCQPGRYGTNCSEPCDKACKSCHPVTGKCSDCGTRRECKSLDGEKSKIISQDDLLDSPDILLAAIIVFGMFVSLLLVVFIINRHGEKDGVNLVPVGLPQKSKKSDCASGEEDSDEEDEDEDEDHCDSGEKDDSSSGHKERSKSKSGDDDTSSSGHGSQSI